MKIRPFVSNTVTPVQNPQLSQYDLGKSDMIQANYSQNLSEMYYKTSAAQFANANKDLVDSQNKKATGDRMQQDLYLKYGNSEIDQKIKAGADLGTVQAMYMDSAKRADDLPILENTWKTDSTFKFQSDMMLKSDELKKKVGPNGEGYIAGMNDWLNSYIPAQLETAPSAQSATEFYATAKAQQVKALNAGMNFEASRRRENAVTTATAAISELTKQSFLEPEGVGAFLNQVDFIADNLAQSGLDPAEVIKLTIAGKSKIAGAHIQNLANTDPMSALDTVLNTDIKDYLSGDDFIQTVSHLDRQAKSFITEKQKAAEQELATVKIVSGIPLDKEDKNDVKAAESFYESITSRFKDQSTGQIVDLNQAKEGIKYYFDNVKGIVPKQMVSDINTAFNYGSLEQRTQAGILLSDIANNANSKSIAEQFNKDESLDKALYMTNLIKLGNAPAEAERMTTEKFDPLNKAKFQVNTDKLITLKVNSGNIETDIKDEFTSSLASLSNLANVYEGYGFQNDSPFFKASFESIDPQAVADYKQLFTENFIRTGDEDLAKNFAMRSLHSRYGSTNANGDHEIMKSAPSVIFPGRARIFNFEWQKIRDTLPAVEGEKFIINPYDASGNDIASINGLYPIYKVNSDGIQQPYLDDEGNHLTYSFTNGLDLHEYHLEEERKKLEMQRDAEISGITSKYEQFQLGFRNYGLR